MNLYAYCNANPLNFIDPYGLCPSQGWDWLKQGGVNLLQGLQDTVFDLGNLALTGNDPVKMLDLILNGPMFESPQWARDKYVGQSDFEYGASKFLSSQGVLILLGAGAYKLSNTIPSKGFFGPLFDNRSWGSVRAQRNKGLLTSKGKDCTWEHFFIRQKYYDNSKSSWLRGFGNSYANTFLRISRSLNSSLGNSTFKRWMFRGGVIGGTVAAGGGGYMLGDWLVGDPEDE